MTGFRKMLNNSSLFRTVYIIDLFFCMISFVQVLAYVLLVPLFCWGMRLVYVNQKRYATFTRLRFGIWIMAFLIFSLFSTLINVSVTLFYSCLMFLHVLLCFVVFYGMHTEPDLDFRRELDMIAKILIVLNTLFNFVGFFCLLFGIHFSYDFNDLYFVRFPVYENRFTGVFFNPNWLLPFSQQAVHGECPSAPHYRKRLSGDLRDHQSFRADSL